MSTALSLASIAQALGGRLQGDGRFVVTRLCSPQGAAAEADLVVALREEMLPALLASPARAAVVGEGMTVPPGRLAGHVVVARPRLALALLLDLFAPAPALPHGVIHPSAVVEPDVWLGQDVSIGPLATVGAGAELGDGCRIGPQATVEAGARLGDGCRIHAGARIGERVVLGARVIVQRNAVVGSDGFGFVTAEEGSVETLLARGRVEGRNDRLARLGSLGTVELDDDVEIGAGTTIDRGTLDATRIGACSKLDNLVQVAHNVTIGRNCLIAGQAGLSGSCRIGDRVAIGGQAGIADHVSVGDDAIVMAAAGVGQDVAPASVVGGLPAVPRPEFLRLLLEFRHLGRLRRDVAALRERLQALEAAAR